MAANRPLEITGVDRIDGDSVLVEFSDDSSTTYSIDQLLSLKSARLKPDSVEDDEA